MFCIAFTDRKATREYRDVLCHDRARLGRFIAAMHEGGIRIIGRGLWYISAAHTERDIDQAIRTAREIFSQNIL
jgi:glutamate-1-semialdehyde 2,1-aminomutase